MVNLCLRQGFFCYRESSATDVSRESEGVAESGSDFSDEVRGRRRRGRRGARKATRKSHRKRSGYSKYDDFCNYDFNLLNLLYNGDS